MKAGARCACCQQVECKCEIAAMTDTMLRLANRPKGLRVSQRKYKGLVCRYHRRLW